MVICMHCWSEIKITLLTLLYFRLLPLGSGSANAASIASSDPSSAPRLVLAGGGSSHTAGGGAQSIAYTLEFSLLVSMDSKVHSSHPLRRASWSSAVGGAAQGGSLRISGGRVSPSSQPPPFFSHRGWVSPRLTSWTDCPRIRSWVRPVANSRLHL